MQISTIYYQLKKMMGINQVTKANSLIVRGLSESFEPSTKSIKNIMAFSDAYQYNKSESIGEIEYLIN